MPLLLSTFLILQIFCSIVDKRLLVQLPWLNDVSGRKMTFLTIYIEDGRRCLEEKQWFIVPHLNSRWGTQRVAADAWCIWQYQITILLESTSPTSKVYDHQIIIHLPRTSLCHPNSNLQFPWEPLSKLRFQSFLKSLKYLPPVNEGSLEKNFRWVRLGIWLEKPLERWSSSLWSLHPLRHGERKSESSLLSLKL